VSTLYRNLDFGLGSDIDMLRETVHALAQAEIAPLAAQIDRDNQFPMPLWQRMGELGLLGITVDED
jgi:isovaleryl-CoA dehydrogenase